jgi:hypothetical protein
MVHMICMLDRLPVELLHIILDYFTIDEIYRIFLCVSDYVDSTIHSIPNIRLNCKSILKRHFDLICCRIRPEQVTSLTLSDADDTPHQSELFFSHFRIERFTRLRSLTLIKLEIVSLEYIFTNFNQLKQLQSLTLDYYDFIEKWGYAARISHLTDDHFDQLRALLTEHFVSLAPRLHRLKVSDDRILRWIQLPNLRHLTLTSCSLHKLHSICHRAPNLKSLDVDLTLGQVRLEHISLSPKITRLAMRIYSWYCLFVPMFISAFSARKGVRLDTGQK